MRDAGRYQSITNTIISEIHELNKTIEVLSARYERQTKKINILTEENRELKKQVRKLSK